MELDHQLCQGTKHFSIETFLVPAGQGLVRLGMIGICLEGDSNSF